MRYALYFHSGCANHGCEAIVRSTCALIKQLDKSATIKLYTFSLEEDKAVGLPDVDEFEEFKFHEGNPSAFKNNFFNKIKLSALSKLSQAKADEFYYSFSCKNSSLRENDIYLSIGGDNYCYGDVSPVIALNRELKHLGKKIVLWGCSIGKDDITEQKQSDLKTYDLIVARESITYENLKTLGLAQSLKLCADPAFNLSAEFLPLPSGFSEGKTIGLNISPLIMNLESNDNKGVGLKAMKKLIDYILENTDNQIAFIPHVTSSHSNDCEPLSLLHDEYKATGKTVLLGSDLNAMQIKGYISRCRAFVGARTHATIAAYSSNVPTLVLGYSVKSIGIAKDIFGTADGLVIPIQKMQNENELVNAFKNLLENESYYTEVLKNVMPKYIESSQSAGKYLLELKTL